LFDNTEEGISERLNYFKILYERSVVALSIYKQSQEYIHESVIKAQEHHVIVCKRQLDMLIEEIKGND